MTAKVSTKISQQGSLRKSILVTTDSTTNARLRLEFSMTVVRLVELRPARRFNLQAVVGEETSETVVLSRIDGKPLEIEAVDVAAGPGVESELRRLKADERIPGAGTATTGEVALTLRLTEQATVGTHTGTVVLTTRHADVPQVKIPVAIRVRPLVEASPRALRMWPSAGNEVARSSGFRLTHSQGRSFEVESLAVSHPEVFTAEVLGGSGGLYQMVTVRLADDLEQRRERFPVRGTVTVRFKGTTIPDLDVPVLVGANRAMSRTLRP